MKQSILRKADRKKAVAFAAALVFLFIGTAGASTLTTIGTATYSGSVYNLIFEGDLGSNGLVWLDYTKASSTWTNQVAWAGGLGALLTVSIDPAYTTSIDFTAGWRLPGTDESQATQSGGYGSSGPDVNGDHSYWYGHNMVNSEMGNLFYESLGNKGYVDTAGNYPQTGWGLSNTGDFTNLQAAVYWSGTEYSAYTDRAWFFNFNLGFQTSDFKYNYNRALAVLPGDISAAAVPEPGTLLLSATGLLVIAARRRHLRRRIG